MTKTHTPWVCALLLLTGCGAEAGKPIPTDAIDLCSAYGGLESFSRYVSDTPYKYEVSIHAHCKDGSSVSRSVVGKK